MTLLAALLAADPSLQGFDWPAFLSGGGGITAASLALGLIGGVLAPGYIYKATLRDLAAARAETATARGEKDAMVKVLLEELVPLLTRNVDVLKAIDAKMEPPTIRLRDPGP